MLLKFKPSNFPPLVMARPFLDRKQANNTKNYGQPLKLVLTNFVLARNKFIVNVITFFVVTKSLSIDPYREKQPLSSFPCTVFPVQTNAEPAK